MWFAGAGGGALRKLCRASSVINNEMSYSSLFVRFMSRERAVNVRKINPKVSIPEAYAISNDLYGLFKQHGPLSVPNTWLRAQEAGLNGLNSKTHMKLLLKWMRGKKMLKLICNHVGNSKKFFHTVLPEDPEQEKPIAVTESSNKQGFKRSSNKQGSKKSSSNKQGSKKSRK